MTKEIIHEKQRCGRCGITKTREEFFKDQRIKSGITGVCRLCKKGQHKIWRSTPDGKAALKRYWQKYYSTKEGSQKIKDYTRGVRMKALGLTLGDYYDAFARQHGLCAICRKPGTAQKRLAIDHDHSTGKFRELLCDLCNRGLGYFKDDPDALASARQYLLKHRQLKLAV